MSEAIHPADLGFFSVLASAGGLGAAARELGVTTAAVSRRLATMESRLGLTLVNRTTRRMGLTPEGETYLEHARRILGEIRGLEEALGASRGVPSGLLRVNATLGFGRSHVAAVVSRFALAHPKVEVRLQLTVNPPPLSEDAWDVCIRFGAPPESRVIARRIAPNRRLLCASPGYLARHGTPKAPADLARHTCIGIRQGDEAYGVWRLTRGRGPRALTQAVRTHGPLATHDGGVAVLWALDGHGIVMRAEWDVAAHLAAGRLVPVLPDWFTPDADVHAIYPHRHQLATRVRAFVDFIERELRDMAAVRAGPRAVTGAASRRKR